MRVSSPTHSVQQAGKGKSRKTASKQTHEAMITTAAAAAATAACPGDDTPYVELFRVQSLPVRHTHTHTHTIVKRRRIVFTQPPAAVVCTTAGGRAGEQTDVVK